MGNDLCACWNGDSASADYEQDAAELLSKFKAKLRNGMPVKKISKDRPVTEIIVTIDESLKFLNFTGVKKDVSFDPECKPRDISKLGIRRATDPDPEVKHFAGSKVLRDNLDPREAMKAFIIEADPDSPSQQTVLVNLLCNAESDTEFLVNGFKLMFKEARGESLVPQVAKKNGK